MSVPDSRVIPLSPPPSAALGTHGDLRWRRADTYRTGGLLLFILAMHVLAFGVLALLVAPHRYALGKQVFGTGLGITPAATRPAMWAMSMNSIAPTSAAMAAIRSKSQIRG